MAFEKLTINRGVVPRISSVVTLTKNGINFAYCAISKDLIDEAGIENSVDVLIDREEKLIGIKASKNGQRLIARSHATSKSVAITHALRGVGASLKCLTQIPAKVENGMIVFSVKELCE